MRPGLVVVVTGTGTEVGKTWVASELLRGLRRRGCSIGARKPVQSFDPAEATTDADVLASATGEDPYDVCPPHRRFNLPMAPPMAAEALGVPSPSLSELLDELSRRWPPEPSDVGLIEGAGGVASPLAADGDSSELARGLPADLTILVADAGLGTLNAVRLCIDRLKPLPVIVHLNRFDPHTDLHRRNRDWLCNRDNLIVTSRIDQLVDYVFRASALGVPIR